MQRLLPTCALLMAPAGERSPTWKGMVRVDANPVPGHDATCANASRMAFIPTGGIEARRSGRFQRLLRTPSPDDTVAVRDFVEIGFDEPV